MAGDSIANIGAVEGLVGDAEPIVSVNGVTARVGDRYFIATGVPLNVGGNTLTVTATDYVGNTRTATVNVTRIQVGANRLSVIGGNNQTGPINTELVKPLTVIALDAQGQPLANKALTFDMLRGTGGIAAAQGGVTSRNLQVTTDSTGQASVYFTTGKQSGFANNVVRVKSIDIPEEVLFYATAQASSPVRISADMLGTNQRAETGAKVLEPLLAIVTDAGDNRVPGITVTYKVEEGDASFDGQQQITVLTDKNGVASARPTLGLVPGKCRITATVDQVGATAFVVTSLAASNQPTAFSGVVLNDRIQPLPGATLSIGRTALTVTTDAQGKFSFDANVPAGKIDLFVDGRTATGVTEVYPALHFEVLAVRGQDNQLPHPIFMPPLNTPETKIVGGDQDVVLRIPGIEGFSMKVFANSVTFPDGTKTGPLVVSRVNQDKLPMVPPGGASIFMAPAWTIQPASSRFDPPIQVTIPNSQGLKPGESNNIYQWDHDLATFVPIGRATVNEDASFLVSDAGSGVTKAGWGGGPPPPPPDTCTSPNSNCPDCKQFDSSPSVCSCVASGNGSRGCNDDECKKCESGSCNRDYDYNTASCCSGEKINKDTQCCIEEPGYRLRRVIDRGAYISDIGVEPTNCPNRDTGKKANEIDGCSVPSWIGSIAFPSGIFVKNPGDIASAPIPSMASAMFYSCAEHDKCYQRCKSDQGVCDSELKERLETACSAIPDSEVSTITLTDPETGITVDYTYRVSALCNDQIGKIYAGLWVGGFVAHNQRQREYCVCCPGGGP